MMVESDPLTAAAIGAAVEQTGHRPAATSIRVAEWRGWPMLAMHDPRRGHAAAILTPASARDIARKLSAAADAAEVL